MDVSLKMTSICTVEADGIAVWQGKTLREYGASSSPNA